MDDTDIGYVAATVLALVLIIYVIFNEVYATRNPIETNKDVAETKQVICGQIIAKNNDRWFYKVYIQDSEKDIITLRTNGDAWAVLGIRDTVETAIFSCPKTGEKLKLYQTLYGSREYKLNDFTILSRADSI